MIAMKIGTCNQWIDAFMTQVWVYFRTFSKYSSPDNICFNLIYKADVFWQNTAVSQIQIIWSNINVTRCCWRSDKRLSFWRMTALSAPAFTHIDALVTFGTGVLLPFGDVYSDICLSVKLWNKSCYDYEYHNCDNPSWGIKTLNLFGWIIWIPIIINLLFTIPHYLRVEKTWKQRLLTFPLLIFQWSN